MRTLFDWGFGPDLLVSLDLATFDPHSGLPPVGRVLLSSHGTLRVATAAGERPATLSGALRDGPPLERPVVGDWVTLTPEGRVESVLPRRSFLVRRDPGEGAQALAANVDTVFVTTSLNGDLNPRRVERFVALIRAAGAEPVIVLTKADLAGDPARAFEAVRAAAAGAEVVSTAAAVGDVAGLRPWLGRGRTACFVGSSGVGKSTLLNALLGGEVASTGAIRAADERGRHTTTERRLRRAGDGSLLLDMPGVREVGLAGDEAVGDEAFPEVVALVGRCRWRDCGHTTEAGCAIREALEAGTLDPGRWAGWLKLRRELEFAARQSDPDALRRARQRWKAVHLDAAARARLRERNRW